VPSLRVIGRVPAQLLRQTSLFDQQTEILGVFGDYAAAELAQRDRRSAHRGICASPTLPRTHASTAGCINPRRNSIVIRSVVGAR
jgi:hypothetical protein